MQQDALVTALADPRAYPHAPANVAHVQTHISHVFLAGPYVYKLKKALRLPFVDQSTVARRRALCEAEVQLNQPLAAPVYLGTLPVTAGADGRPRVGGDGTPLDHLVWMRRLPPEATLTRRVGEGRVPEGLMAQLATTLAAFHAGAPADEAVAAHAAPEALHATWDETLALAAPLADGLLPAPWHRLLTDFGPAFLTRHDTLVRARQRGGHVCEGHGDLHAAHVYLLDAPIPATPAHPLLPAGLYVVDRLEFSAALRSNDVAAELAFAVVDLERLGRPDLGAALVDAYVAATGDAMLRTMLPYYVVHRACVRGAVDGLASREAEVAPADRRAAADRARAYFALAVRHVWEAGPRLVLACAGRSGSGKTTLAARLASATGWAHLSSDRLRKQRAGLDPERPAPDPAALYGSDARTATYAALTADVGRVLATGRGVVVDATWLRRADRERLAAAARAYGCAHVFLACEAPDDVLRARLDARAPGPSDADWRVARAQAVAAEPFAADEPHLEIDTSGDADVVAAEALERLWRWERAHAVPAGHPPPRPNDWR